MALRRMPITGEYILSSFRGRLKKAVRIRIATAWATSGPQLDALKIAVRKKGLKVRAIVGTYGNATEPSALERLHELGKLRLAGNAPLFHPKIYIFEFGSGKSVAWVGSANFTQAGFGDRNVEIMCEINAGSLQGWFRDQWEQLEPATGEAIANYRKHYEEDPPVPEFRKVVGKLEGIVARPSLPPLPETSTWEPVLEEEEIRNAFDRMRKTLIDGAEVKNWEVRGVPDTKVHWRADLGYWCAFHDPDRPPKRYWNAFGLEGPGNPGRTLSRIDLELNPPLDGHHEYAGNCAGLFVRNDRGGVFLARNLNKFGRRRIVSEELENRLEERLPGRIVGVPWRNRTRRMVVLSEVGSSELQNTVAELVKLVAELREWRSART